MSESPGTGAGTASFGATPAPPGAPPEPASGRRRGRAIALTAVTGAIVAVAVAAAVLLATHRPHHVQVASHPLRGTIFQLREGQCLDSPANATAVASAVPCTRPHDAEIYGTFTVPGQHWPGTASLSAQAQRGCQSRLSGYLNPQLATSGLAEFYVYPNQGAWSAGGRSVICEIRGTHGKLTGSVRASSSG
jgi:hypothetical protein